MSIYQIFKAISMLQLTNPFRHFCHRYICNKPVEHIMNKMNIHPLQCEYHEICKGVKSPISCPKNKQRPLSFVSP